MSNPTPFQHAYVDDYIETTQIKTWPYLSWGFCRITGMVIEKIKGGAIVYDPNDGDYDFYTDRMLNGFACSLTPFLINGITLQHVKRLPPEEQLKPVANRYTAKQGGYFHFGCNVMFIYRNNLGYISSPEGRRIVTHSTFVEAIQNFTDKNYGYTHAAQIIGFHLSNHTTLKPKG